MGEREWWANMHYSESGRTSYAGGHCVSREQAAKNSSEKIRCRIHVRLKPEGAPKRYADEEDRWTWEAYPHSRRGGVPASIIVELYEGDLAAGCFDEAEAA